jgi:hypothetical protein
MNPEQVRVERRGAQRFDFQLPVSIRLLDHPQEGGGFTQDVSARGVFFYTEFPVAEGDRIELTMMMPSEITLTETMRVRCRGRVVRKIQLSGGTQFGVAVLLEGYEYLPEVEPLASGTFQRIAALHEHPRDQEAATSVDPVHPRTAPF